MSGESEVAKGFDRAAGGCIFLLALAAVVVGGIVLGLRWAGL